MIDVRLFSFLILSFFMIVVIVGYGLIFILRPKESFITGSGSQLGILIFCIILVSILFMIGVLIAIFVRKNFFYNSKNNLKNILTGLGNKIDLEIQGKPGPAPNTTLTSPVTPSPPVSSPSPSPPVPSQQSTPSSDIAPTTSYYAYNPNTNTLELLNLDNVTYGKQILDTYHKNDESIFVLDDGIITILGNEINRYTQALPIKKVRVLNNEYIGLANGKLYKSKDLANWTVDTTKPNNIIDMDVPFQQENILFIQTPTENLLIDSNNNQIISKEASETRKYGSYVNTLIRKTNDGIYSVKDGMQSLYRGYQFGDISNQNRILLVPNQLKEGYKVIDTMNLDDKLLVKIETQTNKPDPKIQVKDLVYQ
jgi:hypothetical protein